MLENFYIKLERERVVTEEQTLLNRINKLKTFVGIQSMKLTKS